MFCSKNHSLSRNGSQNGYIYFEFPDKRVIREPCIESTSQNFTSVFRDYLVQQMLDNLASLNQQANFFSESLERLNITAATEPLYTFGVQLHCTKDLYVIFKHENVMTPDSKEIFDETFLTLFPREQDISRLLRRLHQYKGRHLLASVANTLNLSLMYTQYRPRLKAKDLVSELTNKYTKEFDPAKIMIDHIISAATLPREKLKKQAELYQEDELIQLTDFMLRQRQCIIKAGRPLCLPFKISRDEKYIDMTCKLDLIVDTVPVAMILRDDGHMKNGEVGVLVHRICNQHDSSSDWMDDDDDDDSKDNDDDENDDGKANDDDDSSADNVARNLQQKPVIFRQPGISEYKISSTLAFQVFEQLLGMMLDASYHSFNSDAAKVFQSQLIVENDKVSLCILTMEYKVYKKLKNVSDAEETLRLLKNLAKNDKHFCNLYVYSETFAFWEIGALTQACQNYFCKVY